MSQMDYAMEIAQALARADAQTLAKIGIELLASLGKAEATLAEMRNADEERRRAARERTRRSRGGHVTSRDVTEGHVTERDTPPLSPTPPFPTPTSPSSSSPRARLWEPADEAALAARLPTTGGRLALAAVLNRCDDKASVAAEVRMILDGGRPNVSARPEHMELALSDYAANGLTDGRFNAAHFRRHVQRAAKGDPPPEPATPGTGARRRPPNGTSPGAQQMANILGREDR